MSINRPFSDADWLLLPETARKYIDELEKIILQYSAMVSELSVRIEKLEGKAECNSQNSNQPPASDPPFNKPERKKKTATIFEL